MRDDAKMKGRWCLQPGTDSDGIAAVYLPSTFLPNLRRSIRCSISFVFVFLYFCVWLMKVQDSSNLKSVLVWERLSLVSRLQALNQKKDVRQ